MAEQRLERRLTAILAADIAGYSRLMGVDEAAVTLRISGVFNATEACNSMLSVIVIPGCSPLGWSPTRLN
jgi:hypothetical protein